MKKTLTHNPMLQSTRKPLALRVRLVSGLTLLALLGGIGLFASRPAHTAGGPVPVTVANTPLATRPVDIATPAQPFALRMDLTFADGFAKKTFTFPANKRLVLTYISSNCAVAPGAKAFFNLGASVNGQLVESHLPLIPQGAIFGHDVYALSSPVTVYADSGTVVTVAILDSDNSTKYLYTSNLGFLPQPRRGFL